MSLKAIILPLFCLTALTCQEPGSDGGDNSETGKLTLTQTGKSLNSVKLKLTKENIPASLSLKLYKNNDSVTTFSLFGMDTSLTFDGLAPSTNYNWYVKGNVNGKELLSNILETRTEDTTLPPNNREFTWRTDTIGKAGSQLKDVAIVDENNVYAVGKFYKKDFSSGDPYNLAHWDGQKWELVKVYIRNYQDLANGPTQLNTIFVLNAQNIWVFSNAGSYGHYNGSSWASEWVQQHSGGINNIWGNAANNLFFASSNGNLSVFNGSSFSLLPQKATLPFIDFFGSGDTALLVASNTDLFTGELFLLNAQTKELSPYATDGLEKPYMAVWFDAKKTVMYASANNELLKKSFSDTTWHKTTVSWVQKAVVRIRGNSADDIMVGGGFGLIAHWNGKDWKEYLPPEVQDKSNGNYHRLASHPKLFVFGAADGNHAYVTMAKRKD